MDGGNLAPRNLPAKCRLGGGKESAKCRAKSLGGGLRGVGVGVGGRGRVAVGRGGGAFFSSEIRGVGVGGGRVCSGKQK